MKRPRTERSVSRGRAHVDKTIEATVKKPEVGGNVRSRKASHMMGIFDPRSGSESPVPEPSDQVTQAGAVREPGKSLSRPISPIQEPVSGWTPRRSSKEPLDDPGFLSRGASQLGSVYGSKATSPLKHDHDPYFRQQDLAEIPGVSDGRVANKKPSHATTPSRKLASDDIKGNQHPSEEEHISAAIYYPHPGPSPEEIERFASPGEVLSPEIKDNRKHPTQVKDIVLTTDTKAKDLLGGAEHIDISVVSQNEKRMFHGNYRPIDELLEAQYSPLSPSSEVPTTAIVSASESEAESGDEVALQSQINDLSTTPTPRATLSRRSTEGQAPSRTKAKVVLEPYKHQVGGHSTIFRFSRRAVCKQLNNRENEFYERIEQRHPDMLKFLPRQVATLLSLHFMKHLQVEEHH